MTWCQYGGRIVIHHAKLINMSVCQLISNQINMGESLVMSEKITTFVLSVVKSETGSTERQVAEGGLQPAL